MSGFNRLIDPIREAAVSGAKLVRQLQWFAGYAESGMSLKALDLKEPMKGFEHRRRTAG